MKNIRKILSLLVLVCILVSCLAACGPAGDEPTTGQVDYAASVKLDMSSNTLKQEVTVHLQAGGENAKYTIDGDTTHFNVPDSVMPGGVLKARYLGINTPESTGKIEPYGKTASNFTHEKLKNAVSIIIESDNDKWNPDSTGNRYLVWVWYKTAEDAEYRNLNIEILQNGLALGSNAADNRYGSTCTAAIAQAQAQKLNVHSGKQDPNFYYGAAVELTLKELRTNIASYDGVLVAFDGIVTRNSGDGVYVEALDEETGLYNGMYIYYGTGAHADMKEKILKPGNEAHIVGTVGVFAGSYQVSGLVYNVRDGSKPNNSHRVSEGHSAAFTPIEADTFANGKVDVIVMDPETQEEVAKEVPYAEMILGSTVEMRGLEVKSIYTTSDGESAGAMSITCEVDGIEIELRTVVLRNADGQVITQDAYEGKTLDIKGIVDYYVDPQGNGTYQIKILSANDITIY